MQETLTKYTIASRLNSTLFGKNIYVFDKISSSNEIAKWFSNEEGTIVIAHSQWKGKGRSGHVWTSTDYQNVLFSFVLHPSEDTLKFLTLLCGFSVATAVDKIIHKENTHIHTELKFPNDVYLCGKKICGIIVESQFSQEHCKFAVVGIGINVNQEIFPTELQEKASSLKLLLNGKKFSRIDVLTNVLSEFEKNYLLLQEMGSKFFLRQCFQKMSMIGKQILFTWKGEEWRALVQGIDDDANIHLLLDDGREIRLNQYEIAHIQYVME